MGACLIKYRQGLRPSRERAPSAGVPLLASRGVLLFFLSHLLYSTAKRCATQRQPRTTLHPSGPFLALHPLWLPRFFALCPKLKPSPRRGDSHVLRHSETLSLLTTIRSSSSTLSLPQQSDEPARDDRRPTSNARPSNAALTERCPPDSITAALALRPDCPSPVLGRLHGIGER